MILNFQSWLLLILKQVTENDFRLISFWFQSRFTATSAQVYISREKYWDAGTRSWLSLVGDHWWTGGWRVCVSATGYFLPGSQPHFLPGTLTTTAKQPATLTVTARHKATFLSVQPAKKSALLFADPPENLNLPHVNNLTVLGWLERLTVHFPTYASWLVQVHGARDVTARAPDTKYEELYKNDKVKS